MILPLIAAVALAAPANSSLPLGEGKGESAQASTGGVALPSPDQLKAKKQDASSRTPRARPTFADLEGAFPEYPRHSPLIHVGSEMDVRGLPMTLVAFETHDDPAKVLEFYSTEFKRQDLFVVGARDLQNVAPYPGITAHDGATGWSRTVMVLPGTNSHTVILGLADAEARLGTQREKVFLGLPPYPGVSTPLSVRTLDGDVATYTLSFHTEDPSTKVLGFFTDEMPRRGFATANFEKAEADLYAAGGQMLGYERDQVRWSITVRHGRSGGTDVVAFARGPASANTETK